MTQLCHDALRHALVCSAAGRAALPRAVLGVHAAFHVLYSALAWRVPRWCVEANITRVEASPLLSPDALS